MIRRSFVLGLKFLFQGWDFCFRIGIVSIILVAVVFSLIFPLPFLTGSLLVYFKRRVPTIPSNS
jgi:hypothetical protein